jgi:hypothetical protein
MKSIAASLLFLLLPISVFAAGPASYTVVYRGGSFPNIKSGTDLSLFIDATTVRLMKGKKQVAEIPASAITEVSYGRDIHRRVGEAIGLALITPFGIGAVAAFTKSKKHYVGIVWTEGDKKGGLAMQCDKNEYRGVLAALEGVSGKKAVSPEALNVKNP